MNNINFQLTHFALTIITVIFLLNIWGYHFSRIRKKGNSHKKLDLGVIFLALALAVWGTINFLKFKGLIADNDISSTSLSLLNNTLFLASFPFFKYGFRHFRNPRIVLYWNLGIIVISIILFIISITIFGGNDNYQHKGIMELILSVITLSGLAFLFLRSFKERKLIYIGIMSFIVISFQIAYQVTLEFKEFSSGVFGFMFNEYSKAIYLASYGALCSLFIGLAFSWINEESSSLYSNFFLKENDKIQEDIKLNIISKKELHERIKRQIADDKIEEALEEVMTFFEKNDLSVEDILILTSRLTRLNTERIRDTINNPDYKIERNKIVNALIKITEKNLKKNN